MNYVYIIALKFEIKLLVYPTKIGEDAEGERTRLPYVVEDYSSGTILVNLVPSKEIFAINPLLLKTKA